jgi:CheY-like chemotaxis protein
MGGQLEVDSLPGAAQTVFSFSVPLPVSAEQAPFELVAPAKAAAPAPVVKAIAPPALKASSSPAIAAPAVMLASSAANGAGAKVQRDFDDLFSIPQAAWTDVTTSNEAKLHVVPGGVAAGGDEKETKRAPAVGLAAATARTPHCLVVDDNAICQKVAKKMLESLGCTVAVASNGLEAVMAIKDAPWSFDFVLMDLRMPVMDGIDATTQIRKGMRLASLPVVAFTAEVGPEVRDLCRDARFDGFLPKPADRVALRGELERLVISPGAGQCSTLPAEEDGPAPNCAATSCAAAASTVVAAGPTKQAKQSGPRAEQGSFDSLGSIVVAPVEVGGLASAGLPPAGQAKGASGLSGPLHVLAVDDNAICLKVVKKMLERLGCTVQLAANGLEAVNAVREAPGSFDFVLMDLRMPVMDGIDATVRIRKELGLTALPIVAFSAEASARSTPPPAPSPPRDPSVDSIGLLVIRNY